MSSLNELRSRENEPLALFLLSFLFRFFDIHFGWKWEPLTPLDWDVGATPSELEWNEKRYRKYSCRRQGEKMVRVYATCIIFGWYVAKVTLHVKLNSTVQRKIRLILFEFIRQSFAVVSLTSRRSTDAFFYFFSHLFSLFVSSLRNQRGFFSFVSIVDYIAVVVQIHVEGKVSRRTRKVSGDEC